MRDLKMRAVVVLAAVACTRMESPMAAETTQLPKNVICDNAVSPAYVKLGVGDTTRLEADLCRPGGPVRWTISHLSVAQIDSLSGVLRALAVGSATVTAASVQDPNNKSAGAVEVVARP